MMVPLRPLWDSDVGPGRDLARIGVSRRKGPPRGPFREASISLLWLTRYRCCRTCRGMPRAAMAPGGRALR
jgi:hypothetical protein